jgi:outer membrane protein assembly factor BamB
MAVRPGDKSPKIVWESHKDIPYMSTLVSHGNFLYYVTDKAFVGCCEAETGKRLWQERLGDADFSSSPLLIGGKVYVANQGGDVFVFNPSPTKLELLARNSLNEAIMATPAVSDERLFIRGQKHMFCIGKR